MNASPLNASPMHTRRPVGNQLVDWSRTSSPYHVVTVLEQIPGHAAAHCTKTNKPYSHACHRVIVLAHWISTVLQRSRARNFDFARDVRGSQCLLLSPHCFQMATMNFPWYTIGMTLLGGIDPQ